MCMTSGPAKLSKTKLMSIKLDDINHLLAYSNTVENLSNKPNSMIFPVPGKLSQEDFFDTTKYAKFLNELEEGTKPRSRSLGKSKSIDSLSFVENFKIGMYNIFVSESASAIGDVISKLPESERPEISKELLSFFETHYPGWSFVVCCFAGNQKVEAQPIMFKFKPFNKDILFFPGMDSHTGGAPDLTKPVDTDHYLITSTDDSRYPFEFKKNDVPEILKGKHYIGDEFDGMEKNGDWYIDTTKNNEIFRHQTPIIKAEVHA